MTNIITSKAQFEDLELTVIHKDGERWLTAEQVGKALELKHPRRAVWKIFTRHKEEFEEWVDFSVPKLVTEKGERETLVFSPTGCMLLGMFARTPRAAAFRRWAKHLLADSAASEIRLLREMNASLRRELLAARPFWRSIAAMKEMRSPEGERLSNQTIARALGVHRDTLRKHLRRMEALGLIQPDPAYAQYRRMAAHLPLFRNLDNLH